VLAKILRAPETNLPMLFISANTLYFSLRFANYKPKSFTGLVYFVYQLLELAFVLGRQKANVINGSQI